MKLSPLLPVSKGAHVLFADDPYIWTIEDPETFQCALDCKILHEGGDCTTEPHVLVKREIFTSMPVSQLRLLFDKKGVGHGFHAGHHWDCKCEECL